MTKNSWVLGLLLAGAMSVTASTPVAMRVELEPVRQVGALTEVAVVVQVSPEDRVRIGSNAILRIELDGGTVSSGSPMRAVRVEDDGSARVVVEWPPGEHHLRVEIEDPNREDSGLWVGTVRIPDLGGGAGAQEIDEPQSDPESEPEPVPAPVPVPENSQPETPPSPVADDAVGAAPAATSATTPDVIPSAEPASEPAPVVQESVDAEAIAEATPESPASDPPSVVAPATVGAAAVPEVPVPMTEEIPAEFQQAEPDPITEEASAPEEPPAEEPESPQKEEPAEVAEEPPFVEPLRADPPRQTAEPEAAAGHQQVETAPGLVPVSADLAGRYQEWGNTDPNTREFSIILLRGREPAMGIDITDLRLRVGSSEVPVERLGDVGSAPLLLGLAIDVVPDGIYGWSGMQGSLAPIVERAGDGRGRLFVASPSGVGGWDAEPALSDRTGGSSAPMNITHLVVASLERFEGQRGRTFLVVLTDGRDEPSKDEWQQATDSAGIAGVPILVVALWDDDFNNRSRKNLKKLTEVSGGSLFLVQGRAQLESAADRFGRYLDGGYSIRFNSPGGDMQSVTKISVSASDKKVDVSAPKSIR